MSLSERLLQAAAKSIQNAPVTPPAKASPEDLIQLETEVLKNKQFLYVTMFFPISSYLECSFKTSHQGRVPI
jgi:hypothetical protein